LKIRILSGMAGIDFSYSAGDIVGIDDATAEKWIKAGLAEPIESPKAGGKDEIKNNNPSSSGAIDADGGKTTPKNKRNR